MIKAAQASDFSLIDSVDILALGVYLSCTNLFLKVLLFNVRKIGLGFRKTVNFLITKKMLLVLEFTGSFRTGTLFSDVRLV